MSPEVHAIELMHEELEGDLNPNLRKDITKFLIRAQRELTPEEHQKFRDSLSEVLAREEDSSIVAMSFGALFGSNTGLKVDFNKFVGTCWKLRFSSDTQKREAAALGAYNEGEEPTEQLSPETDPSESTEIYTESSNDVSSLSTDGMPESGASPTTFAGSVPEQSPE